MSIILILSLWLSFILFKARGNNKSSLFLSSFYFLCGIDVLLKIIRDFLIYNSTFDIIIGNTSMHNKILIFIYILNTLSYILMPISFFTFAAFNTDFVNSRHIKIVAFLAASVSLIYILIIDILFPVGYYSFHLRESNRMLPFHIWNTLLIIFSGILSAVSYHIEIRPSVKKEKRIVFYAFIVPISIFIIARYALTYLRLSSSVSITSIVITVSLMLIYFYLVKQGLLGLRFNIEYYKSPILNRILSTNASMFNHSLKNDVLKISLQTQIIKKYSKDNMEILKSIASIDDITNRILNCIIKTNDSANDDLESFTQNNVFSILEIVDESIESVKIFANDKQIKFENLCDKALVVNIDRIILNKLFENILINSIESIKDAGKISVTSKEYKKYLLICINDTGEGISKDNLDRILQPYFSTKHKKNNFGLGLYYCNKTMKNLHGSLEIDSELNKGTSVSLYFPSEIILRYD
jgi:two-component system sporulation sensor kinase B